MSRADVFRLTRLIKDLLATRKATVEAIAENTQATNKAAEQRPPEPLKRITVDVQIPSEETSRYYTEQKKSNRLQWWTFGATVATFIAVAVYAGITYLQLRTMQRQLESADRPWLGVDFPIRIKWITVSQKGMGVDWEIPVKNYGSRPAMKTQAEAFIATTAAIPIGGKTFWNHSDIACMPNRPPPVDERARDRRGVVIFPGITTPFPGQLGGGLFKPGGLFEIIGCIAYEFPAGKIHHTRFCFVSDALAEEFKPGDKLSLCDEGNSAN